MSELALGLIVLACVAVIMGGTLILSGINKAAKALDVHERRLREDEYNG